jgi:hypothetical protein
MQQRITYKHFLVIGISAFTVSFAACQQEVEFRMRFDIVFSNVSDSKIAFTLRPDGSSNTREMIVIDPQSQSQIFSYHVDGVGKELNIETCCQELLLDVYGAREIGGGSQRLIINDTLCVTQRNEKSVILSNYAKEIIDDRHFRYKYTFTIVDIENAVICD